jgi:hypothetical protein
VGQARRVTRKVPVVLFAHRRADLLARTLASLRTNGAPLIHAFSDGARSEAEVADVAEVRRLLREVGWAEMHLVERPANVGLNASITDGISNVLAIHEEIVVCEDDIEFAPGAYAYLLAALERYRHEPRVMSISGWTHPCMTPADARDVPHFTGRFLSWGWATWRRAWEGFPGLSAAELRDRCVARGIDIGKYGRDIPDWFAAGVDLVGWDYKFGLHLMLHDGLTLLPPHAMTVHTGNDVRASHPQDRTEWKDRAESPPPPGEIRWPEVRENAGSAECWRRAMEPPPPPSLVKRIRRRLARIVRERLGRGPDK